MRCPRLYTSQPLTPGTAVTLEPRPARHAAQVLRLTAGDAVTLFNGDGRDYAGRIAPGARGLVTVQIDTAGETEPTPPLAITLGLGISKGERMDFALQKAVELGVARIAPLNTSRGVVRLDRARLEKRHQHWAGVIIAACEQSGRRRLPILDAVGNLADWLGEGQPNGLVLDHRAEQSLPAMFPDWAANGVPLNTSLTLLIGPEGGLGPGERDQARQHGFTGVRLGPRILRTETAPLAAIAIIQALWGDLRERPA